MYTFRVLRPFFNPVEVQIEKTEPKPYGVLNNKIKDLFANSLNFPYSLEVLEKAEETCHADNQWVQIENDLELQLYLFSSSFCKVRKVKITGATEDLIESSQVNRLPELPLIDKTVAFKKMFKNSMRAINESRADYDLLKHRFAYPMDEALIIDLGNTTIAPFKLDICADIAEDIGSRSSMEDAHFYVATEYGLLAGVFDGHAGSRTAQSIASAFPQIFEEQMRLSDRHVRYAFTKTFEILHKAFFDIYDDGSAGVVSLIDVESNLIYTATLGDSEASISRCIDDEYSLIPLSCVRDWTCKKEYERGAASFKADKKRAEAFRSEMSTLKQKHLRYSPNKVANDARFPYDGNPGPNLSRAFGDKPFFTYNSMDVMSCKPKISVQYLRPGDLVLIACDGLWDYLDKHEIIEVLREADDDLPSGSSIPLELIKNAKTNFPYRGGGDNISIIALTVGYAS